MLRKNPKEQVKWRDQSRWKRQNWIEGKAIFRKFQNNTNAWENALKYTHTHTQKRQERKERKKRRKYDEMLNGRKLGQIQNSLHPQTSSSQSKDGPLPNHY